MSILKAKRSMYVVEEPSECSHSHDVRLSYSENKALDELMGSIESHLYEDLRSLVIDAGGNESSRMNLSILYNDSSVFSQLVQSRIAIWGDFSFLGKRYTNIQDVENIVLDTILSEL